MSNQQRKQPLEIKKKYKTSHDREFSTPDNAQLEIISLTEKLLKALINNDQLPIDTQIVAKAYRDRLDNIAQRLYYLKYQKRRFTEKPDLKKLYVPDCTITSQHDDLIHISILLQELRLREKRLEIKEKELEEERKYLASVRALTQKLSHKGRQRRLLKLETGSERSISAEKDVSKSKEIREFSEISSGSDGKQVDKDQRDLTSSVSSVSISDMVLNDTQSEISEAPPEKSDKLGESKTQIENKSSPQVKREQPKSQEDEKGGHMKLYFEKVENFSKSKQLEKQRFKCANCGKDLKKGKITLVD